MASIDRKLVTVRKVAEIQAIPGADNIELAIVDGWQCVVKKGEFQPGQLGLYFEIDSAIPVSDNRFYFLDVKKKFKDQDVFVLKTKKLRGQISQGLLLPLSQFPELFIQKILFGLLTFEIDPEVLLRAGHSFDKQLGIEKYEKEEIVKEPDWTKSWLNILPKSWKTWIFNKIYRKIRKGKLASTFPRFIPRTDEDRVQNVWQQVSKDKTKKYEVSIKLDGSSMTFWYYDDKFGFASRNQKLGIGDGSRWEQVVLKYKLADNFSKFCQSLSRNLAFQGEMVDPDIQGNFENCEELEFYLFNIFDIDTQKYLTPEKRFEIFNKYNSEFPDQQLTHVPIFDKEKDLSAFDDIKEILEDSDGPGMNPKTKFREGKVYKALDGSLSFKVISNSYLLKRKD